MSEITTKEVLYKIYDSTDTFITTWTDVISDLNVKYTINGGISNLVVRLARPETEFGENEDVKQGNRLKVYVFDTDSGTEGVQVFSGICVSYTPYIEGGEEYVEVEFYANYWDMANKIMYVGGKTEMVYNSYDPSIILRDVLNRYSNYSDSVIDYVDYGGSQLYDSTLVAYYRFDSGNLTVDDSGNTHTLTAISDPAEGSTGFWGGCVVLDSNDAYSAVDHSDFKPTGVFTIFGWVKTASSSVGVFQSYSANTNVAGIRVNVNPSGMIQLLTGKNTGTVLGTDYQSITGGTAINDNQWHFVVITWNGTHLNLYIDGEADAVAVAWADAPAYAATNYVRIGCRNTTGSNTDFLTGSLSQIGLINGKALSATEISDIYNRFIKSGTIDLTGTTVSYTFNTQSYQEALKKIIELTPENWFFRIGADDKVYLEQMEATPSHYFTIGKDILEYKPEKRFDNIVNTIYFRGKDTLYKRYTNSGSVATYGVRALSMVDERVSVQATADLMADKILDEKNSPEIRVVLKIMDNNGEAGEMGYDIESIKVGQTCKIENATTKSNNLWDESLWDSSAWDYDISNASSIQLQIVSVDYHLDYAILELSNRQPEISRRVEDINRNLRDSQTFDNPTSPTV